MIDWLNDNSGAVQGIAVAVLVVVTVIYAALTLLISRAARRQADANVEMAREMREQRLSPDRPNVYLTLDGTVPGSLLYIPEETSGTELDRFPQEVHFTAANYGPGVALNLSAIVYFKDGHSFTDRRDVLVPAERWPCKLGTRFPLSVNAATRPGDILGSLGAKEGTCGVAVTVHYEDVHGRTWASYMGVHLGADETNNPHEPREWALYAEQGERGIRPPGST